MSYHPPGKLQSLIPSLNIRHRIEVQAPMFSVWYDEVKNFEGEENMKQDESNLI